MPSVLLLGAGSDMAVAVARGFAKDNYDIILAGRDIETLAAIKADIEIRNKVRCEAMPFDALNFSSHKFFVHDLPFFPDITVCAFGYLGDQEKAVTDWREAERIIQTNYVGAVSVLNIIAELYIAEKKGIIAGISSVAGERGRQSNYIYGSAKGAFTTYLSGLRNRLYKYGVHVLTVQPGFVYSKMTADVKLPKLLTATPEQVATSIKTAIIKKRNIVYIKWFWKWIMMIIKMIPETVFRKMKL